MTGREQARVRAVARARRAYRSVAFRRAYLRGWAAAQRGLPAEACPYPPDGRATWRRSYRRAWLRGWESGAPRPPRYTASR